MPKKTRRKPSQQQLAGRKGGRARARSISPERRRAIAQAGAKARWEAYRKAWQEYLDGDL